jgi:AcrR family transcriptional regulator
MKKTQEARSSVRTPDSPAGRRTGRAAHKRRRGSRNETRQRLVDAAIELIRQGGAERLTTVRVAAGAGIVQSGFYMHFRNIDEIKRAAAQQIAADVRQFIAEHRRRGRQGNDADPEAVHEHYQATLQLFLFERRFAELLLRYRHDPSPLGEVLRELIDQLRGDLVDDLRQLVLRIAPGAADERRLTIYADVVMGMVMAVGEGLLDGRYDDPEPLARELTLASFALAKAAMENPPD